MREHLKQYLDQGRAQNVRGLRVLLEYFYATEQFAPLRNSKIPVISVFGSARARPKMIAFKQSYELGKRLYRAGYAVVTGASRGVMAAANRGVADAIATELLAKAKRKNKDAIIKSAAYRRQLKRYSLGLSISLPFEEDENPWVGSAATFHYFMIRKFFFATLSQGFIACEGGWGTRDELFEILTLVQTGKSPLMPVIYISPEPEHLKVDLAHALRLHYIDDDDMKLINIVKRPAAALHIVERFYRHVERIKYTEDNVIRLYLKKESMQGLQRRVKTLWKRYGHAFDEYRWHADRLDLIGFHNHSYGLLRAFIDDLNRTR